MKMSHWPSAIRRSCDHNNETSHNTGAFKLLISIVVDSHPSHPTCKENGACERERVHLCDVNSDASAVSHAGDSLSSLNLSLNEGSKVNLVCLSHLFEAINRRPRYTMRQSSDVRPLECRLLCPSFLSRWESDCNSMWTIGSHLKKSCRTKEDSTMTKNYEGKAEKKSIKKTNERKNQEFMKTQQKTTKKTERKKPLRSQVVAVRFWSTSSTHTPLDGSAGEDSGEGLRRWHFVSDFPTAAGVF